MAPPYTPELDTIKLPSTLLTLQSPNSSPSPQKVMAEKSPDPNFLPLTPKTTPAADGLMDSFREEQVGDNNQAAKMSIDRLTNGHTHTADFVPLWPAPDDGSLTDSPPASAGDLKNTSRYSNVETLAAYTGVGMASLPTNHTVPQKDEPPTTSQSFHKQARGDPQNAVASRPSTHALQPIDGRTANRVVKATPTIVHESGRKAKAATWHNSRPSVVEGLKRHVRESSDTGWARQPLKPHVGFQSKIWFDLDNTPEGQAEYWNQLRAKDARYARLQKPLVDAAVRIVGTGTSPWNRYNVPRAELDQEVARWGIQKAMFRKGPKPRSRQNAQKNIKKPHPAPAESFEILPSLTTKRRRPEVTELSLSDPDDTVLEEESEYSDEPRAKKPKTTGSNPQHSAKDQDDELVPEQTKAASGRRKRAGEEQGRSSKRAVPKKRKVGTRGNGEGKVKSKKDTRLGDIKAWLDSKTSKYVATSDKKHDKKPELDHKGDWQSLNFVRLPTLGSKIDTATVEFDEKLGAKGPYHGGDSTGLHAKELEVAYLNNLSYDQYRCQKRRIFAARAVFDQIHEREGLAASWGKTQTQLVGHIDANKSSFLFVNFNNWGWFESMKEEWTEDYLESLATDFLDWCSTGTKA